MLKEQVSNNYIQLDMGYKSLERLLIQLQSSPYVPRLPPPPATPPPPPPQQQQQP